MLLTHFCKNQCDGRRPQCSACSTRDISCVYTTIDQEETHVGMLKRENEALKQRLEPLAEVLTLLQTASADLAQVIFLKLRHGDAATVLNFIKGAVPGANNGILYISKQ